MRFGTKILLLMLLITVGLSGVVVWEVTRRVTATEHRRANAEIRRTIIEYADRLNDRANVAMRTVHLLLEIPQNRAYLQELDEAGPDAAPDTLVQVREEILGRQLQTELGANFVPPAFHVVVNRDGRLLAFAASEGPARVQGDRLRALRWPGTTVIESGELQKLYVQLERHLYLVFGMPLRVEMGGNWTLAYFVGFEVDDNWVRALLGTGGDTPLRVVVQLDGVTIARTSSDDTAERALAAHTANVGRPQDVEQFPLEFTADRERFVGEALIIPSARSDTLFAFYSSLDYALRPLRELQRSIAILTGVVIVLAVLIARLLSRMLANPVEKLVAGTERISRGEFAVPIDMDRRDELGTLARSFNQMAAGLEQRDLIKDTFGKFVDPQIVQSLLDDPSRLRLGGERRVQTVLFADLENFTAISERLDPEALFRLLNGYLEDAADVIGAHRGIIDKFIGDGVVAFWGPPVEQDHAAQACRAALALVRRTTEHDDICRELSLPALRARVGIATGEVLIGNIGSRSKYNYTVMGDVANLASRLEGVNKLYRTQILVTDAAVRAAGAAVASRLIDTVRVLGRSDPVELHEVLGESSDVDGEVARRIDSYAAALLIYRARRWADARRAFEQIGDPPSQVMAGRCALLAEHDPGPAWDGVWNLDRK